MELSPPGDGRRIGGHAATQEGSSGGVVGVVAPARAANPGGVVGAANPGGVVAMVGELADTSPTQEGSSRRAWSRSRALVQFSGVPARGY
jgi:hypothetical protein